MFLFVVFLLAAIHRDVVAVPLPLPVGPASPELSYALADLADDDNSILAHPARKEVTMFKLKPSEQGHIGPTVDPSKITGNPGSPSDSGSSSSSPKHSSDEYMSDSNPGSKSKEPTASSSTRPPQEGSVQKASHPGSPSRRSSYDSDYSMTSDSSRGSKSSSPDSEESEPIAGSSTRPPREGQAGQQEKEKRIPSNAGFIKNPKGPGYLCKTKACKGDVYLKREDILKHMKKHSNTKQNANFPGKSEEYKQRRRASKAAGDRARRARNRAAGKGSPRKPRKATVKKEPEQGHT